MKPNRGSNSRLHRQQLQAVGVTLPGSEVSEPEAPAVRQSRHVRSPRRAPASEAEQVKRELARDSTKPEVRVSSGGQQANVLTSTVSAEVKVTAGGQPRDPSPGVTVTSGKGKKGKE